LNSFINFFFSEPSESAWLSSTTEANLATGVELKARVDRRVEAAVDRERMVLADEPNILSTSVYALRIV
jgi:hypothetical protein